METANIVLIVRVMIMILMTLSKSLYLPINNIIKQMLVIPILQKIMLAPVSKRLAANPAVTIVTAVWMVNMVAIFRKK